jgi:hypothetical protein
MERLMAAFNLRTMSVPERRKFRGIVTMGVLSIFALLVFALLPKQSQPVTYGFVLGGEWVLLKEWIVDSKSGALLFALLSIATAALALLLFIKKRSSRIVSFLFGSAFLMSFLCWAAAGKFIPLTGLLQGGLLLSVPLIFGAMAGVISERSGVINIAIEGQLLAGEEPMPFSYSIQTRFSDFPNRNQIRFNWSSSSSIEDLEALSITELCQRNDIYLKSFLFNLENFKSNMLTRLSGFGPVVAETICLEISATTLDIQISAEAISSLKVIPFSKDAVLKKISSLLENCYQFKLLSDYTTLQGELK